MPGFNLKGMAASLSDTRTEQFRKSFSRVGGGDFKFKPMYWSSLVDGKHMIRLLPKHPTKCPQGFLRLGQHKIEIRMGEKPQEVVCTYQPGKEGADCYVCDLLESIQEELSTFGKDVQAAIEMAAPRTLFLFPAIVQVKPDPKFVPTEGRKYAPWVFDERARQGAILQLEGKRVLTALFDVLQEYPEANDPDEGYWLSVTKMGKELPIIRAAKSPSPLTAAEAEMMVDREYPALYPVPKFMKGLQELNYDQQKTLVSQAWWAKEVIAEETELEFGPDEDIPF